MGVHFIPVVLQIDHYKKNACVVTSILVKKQLNLQHHVVFFSLDDFIFFNIVVS